MLEQTIEYPPLTEEMLIDLDDKIFEHSITVEDCKLLDHYYSAVTYPGRLLELLKEADVHSLRRAAYILRGHKSILDKVSYYPRVLGLFDGCFLVLQEHLDRGEKIQ